MMRTASPVIRFIRAATRKRPGRRLAVLRHQQRSSLGEMFSNAAATPTVRNLLAIVQRLLAKTCLPGHRVNHDFTLQG